MTRSITIDPVTRIEGHLAIKIETDDSKVTSAFCCGEMFRGFEVILKGRHPLDAQQITQRICGVCPISHGIASISAQDQAYDIVPSDNGRLIRNLILGANYIQSHILHFYHLAALDFVDVTAVLSYTGKDAALLDLKAWIQQQLASKTLFPAAPFLPRYEGDYIQSGDLNVLAVKHYLEGLEMRKLAHRMGTIFAGKMPHAASLIPGGVSQKVTPEAIAAYGSMLNKLKVFIDEAYLPDVKEVAGAFPEYFELGAGPGNFLSYGVFVESADDKRFLPAGVVLDGALKPLDLSVITESVSASFFSSPSGLHPANGATTPAPGKADAYSWLKAPRYGGKVMEVGPLARMFAAYQAGGSHPAKTLLDKYLTALNLRPASLVSVLGRHLARALEAKIVADRCSEWLAQLQPGKPSSVEFTIPASGSGVGLVEAARGALGHWLTLDDHKIGNYQCVVPTTWNCSPRDERGVPGPVEQALVGVPVKDPKHPLEAVRVVRSFDPCIACAVH